MTENDVKVLVTRVRPTNHPDTPSHALVVTCRNAEVNQINEERLKLIDEKEYEIQSINRSSTKKEFKPRVEAGGNIAGTPLQRILKLKVGAKVMLTYNINTFDCLTNGALGVVLGFGFNKDGSIKEVLVSFHDVDCGREKRKNLVALQQRFPGENVTPIELMEFQYTLSKKGKSGSASATSLQFPIKLAFAATAHKVQGQTIKKPNSLVIDLRHVREAAQAYVILSRVQALSQLFILESLCEKKIIASLKAIDELERMNGISEEQKQVSKTAIISCNIRSIKKNFENFNTSSTRKQANVMCLQETWMDPLAPQNNFLENEGWEQHNNSIGKGKGITTFYKMNYAWVGDVTQANFQITKLQSEAMDLINIYRSAGANNKNFLEKLFGMMTVGKTTMVVGDFNICYVSEFSNCVFQALRIKGFQQIVKKPTHMEGRLIDLVFFLCPDQSIYYEVQQKAQYFTDHDLLTIVRGNYIII